MNPESINSLGPEDTVENSAEPTSDETKDTGEVELGDQNNARAVWAIIKESKYGELTNDEILKASQYRGGKMELPDVRKITEKYCVNDGPKNPGKPYNFKWNYKYKVPESKVPEEPDYILDEDGNIIYLQDTVKADWLIPEQRFIEPETPEGKIKKRKNPIIDKETKDEDYVQGTLTGLEWIDDTKDTE